jgi:hypothetical protein
MSEPRNDDGDADRAVDVVVPEDAGASFRVSFDLTSAARSGTGPD